MKDDPYNDIKKVHLAALIYKTTGEVSAACYLNPRAINLKKESWTLNKNFVTCAACMKQFFDFDFTVREINHDE